MVSLQEHDGPSSAAPSAVHWDVFVGDDPLSSRKAARYGYLFAQAPLVDRALDRQAALVDLAQTAGAPWPRTAWNARSTLPHDMAAFGDLVQLGLSPSRAQAVVLGVDAGLPLTPMNRRRAIETLGTVDPQRQDPWGAVPQSSEGAVEASVSEPLMALRQGWAGLLGRIAAEPPTATLAPNAPQTQRQEAAQGRTRLIYQWVMIYDWLRRICDPVVFGFALTKRGPLYRRRRALDRSLGLPLELVFAALPVAARVTQDLAYQTPVPTSFQTKVARDALLWGRMTSLPSAQDCIAGVEHAIGYSVPAMTQAQLLHGPCAPVLTRGDLLSNTPLWFYLLHEARIMGEPGRLGPLGSLLLADTLVGLFDADPASVMNRLNRHDMPWSPDEVPLADGRIVRTLADVMQLRDGVAMSAQNARIV